MKYVLHSAFINNVHHCFRETAEYIQQPSKSVCRREEGYGRERSEALQGNNIRYAVLALAADYGPP